MLEGKYCQIINKFTKKIIAAGKIVNHKNMPIKCISFDNKHFFNLNKKILYKFIFCDYCDEVKFDNIKYKNKIILWRYVYKRKNSFVYRDYDITELDEEIKDLVYILNKLNIKTSGSCSGHNTDYAWVEINFESFNQMRKILEIISKEKFFNKFVLTSYNVSNIMKTEITLRLQTQSIGKKAYTDINYLVKYLNEMYKIIEHIPEFNKK